MYSQPIMYAAVKGLRHVVLVLLHRQLDWPIGTGLDSDWRVGVCASLDTSI